MSNAKCRFRLKKLRIHSMSDEEINEYVKMKVSLIRLHDSYAQDAGFEGDNNSLMYSEQDAIRVLSKGQESCYFMLNHENEIVGFCQTRIKNHPIYDNQKCLRISNIYVKRQHRNQGYMSKTLSILSKKKKLPLFLHVFYGQSAEKLYESFGFKSFCRDMLTV